MWSATLLFKSILSILNSILPRRAFCSSTLGVIAIGRHIRQQRLRSQWVAGIPNSPQHCLTLVVVARSRRPLWMTSSGHKKVHEIIDNQWYLEEHMFNVMVITLSADGLAPLGAKPYECTLMVMFGFSVYMHWNITVNPLNISRTLVGNEIVDHANVVGVGAAPITSSFWI